jgi:hypothetical protein
MGDGSNFVLFVSFVMQHSLSFVVFILFLFLPALFFFSSFPSSHLVRVRVSLFRLLFPFLFPFLAYSAAPFAVLIPTSNRGSVVVASEREGKKGVGYTKEGD